MPAAAIRTDALTKDYGSGRGLFDVTLEIEPQQVFGYLGPNGAGKSTTIRLLMGMIHPTRGSSTIFGLDCQRDSVEVKKLVGYMPGELPEFGGLRGDEVVAYMSALRGDVEQSNVRSLAERFQLELRRPFREYSRGNKVKLALVLAFMHRPRLLILDEPTSGLDPLIQQQFYGLVRESVAGGATVLLSSHVLADVEHVCDRVGIIRAGRLVNVAELEEIHRMRLHRLSIRFRDTPPVEELRRAGLSDVAVHDHEVTGAVRGGFDPILRILAAHDVAELVSREPTLEEVFLSYYGAEAANQSRQA